MTKTIGVGLVGVGNWPRYGHIPALRLLPEYEIVAVSNRSAERAGGDLIGRNDGAFAAKQDNSLEGTTRQQPQ